VLVVPALRDVYPDGPDRDAVRRLREVALDVDYEAQALREALAYALAQWGQRDLVQGRIDELTENVGDGSDTDELHFVRELADVHYELREYRVAAALWQRFVDGMQALDAPVSALDWYNVACVSALAGRTDAALAAIERCAALLAVGKNDSTTAITRSMFETDPDLRSIRGTERFAAATARAFGGPGAGEETRR
jgi:tetratricopeptide (TPR) repeat protein